MKNKRLLIILIIFAFLTLLVVLGSTLFTVSDVSIKWHTSKNYFATINNSEIIQSGKFNVGESVFLVNKKQYVNTLEKQNPYLKVISIETVFPNKLVVNVAEREVLYALQVSDNISTSGNGFVLLDGELKVLAHCTESIFLNENPPILLKDDPSLTDEDFEVGEWAVSLVSYNLLKDFCVNLKRLGNASEQIIKGLINQITAQNELRREITISTDFGVVIVIEDADNKFFEKLQFGFSAYNILHDSNNNTGTIIVFETQNGTIEAAY